MNVDPKVMREVAEALYVTMVVQQHGDAGGAALQALLASLHVIYQHLDPDSVKDRVVIFKALEEGRHPLPKDKAVIVVRPESLGQDAKGPVAIEVLESGEFRLWKETSVGIADLATVAVVYEYANRAEFFFAKEAKRPAPRFHSGHGSMFALPTFSDLREALDWYRTKFARLSTCEILGTAWNDSNRLFLNAGPEFIMRKSLTQFLLARLRNAEVRPEQIVDETHPVDIKVTWMFTNRLALIEIKWLGQSKNEAGEITTGHTASRARDGAEQLADYLDKNRVRAPEHVTRGYLVVFDARRRGLKASTKAIDRTNGMHYADEEIEYDPKYHDVREDFEVPVRLFVEPKCA